MRDPSNHTKPDFSQQDLSDPLKWLENLSQERLRDWLRRALWTRIALPLVIPSMSRIPVEVSEIFKHGSPKLKASAREILPTLLQEWGRDEPKHILDDLLIICGRLRAAAAEAPIADIVTRRLEGADAIELRQRALSVLSGFGCTARTASLFEQYLNDIEYAAIAYRALYRFDLKYAATELQTVVGVFQVAPHELDIVIRTLFRDLQSPAQMVDVLVDYLKEGEPKSIIDVVEALRGADVLNGDLLIQVKPTRRVQVFRLLLERPPPAICTNFYGDWGRWELASTAYVKGTAPS
jgi:hypothetical protein